MKSLITAAASLMILLAFLVQFTHSQMLQSRLLSADQAVCTFGEIVRQEGCVSIENEKKLKGRLAEILQCGEEQVSVEGCRSPVFRGDTVEYTVIAPVDSVIAMAGFWGISRENNRFSYEVSRTLASEYTERER